MDFKEIIQKTYKLCKITNISIENKLKIADAKKIGIENYVNEMSRPRPDKMRVKRGWTEDLKVKHIRWANLRTTTKVISRHTGTVKESQLSIASHIHRLAYGEDYDVDIPETFHTSTTFKEELCDDCKKLEAEYDGDDSKLWKETNPWQKQYYRILQSVIADGYKAFSAVRYFDDELQKIKHTLTGNTPAGTPWEKILLHWRIGVESSRLTFYQGKMCFFNVDYSTYKQFKGVQKGEREEAKLTVAKKYVDCDEDVLKCVGGIYILNRRKLCKKCKANIEPDPVEIGNEL